MNNTLYLLRDLQQLRAVELTIGGDRYLCRTELAGNSYEAFKALGIRPPLQIEKLKNKRETEKKKEEPKYFNFTLFPDTEWV